MNTFKLSRANWKLLANYNLTDGNEGNGFVNTTNECDKLLPINAYCDTYVKIKNTIFTVRYYSGCFYPCWFIATFKNKTELNDIINKSYVINEPLKTLENEN